MDLTIITPSYNQGKYISQTFDSILNQKLNFSLEYIILDSMSTDNTDKVIRQYLPKFKKKNIKTTYICEKDNGQSDAINKGFKLASGKIVTWLNSDDYYEPNILKTVVDYFNTNNSIKWLFGGANYVNSKGKTFFVSKPKPFNYQSFLNYCQVPQPSCFFRKELLNKCGFLDINKHLAMDYDLWLRFLQTSAPKVMSQILSNMRYHQGSKSSSSTIRQLYEVYDTSSKYSRAFSLTRVRQLFYLFRGIVATKLNLSTIQKA